MLNIKKKYADLLSYVYCQVFTFLSPFVQDLTQFLK